MTNIPHPIYSIYLITNLVNNKKYVGFTSQNPPNKRWNCHINGSGITVSNAIQKYDKENFKFEVILQGWDREHVLSMETYFIKEFNTLSPNGYNLTTGGELTIYSNESKIKMSIARKGVYSGKNHPLYGKPRSDDTKEKLRKANIGKIIPQEIRDKISKSNNGKGRNIKLSDEHKQKLRLANLGNSHSQETKDKISKSSMGIKNKRYLIEFPDGCVEEINGLLKFCDTQNISASALINSMKRFSHHKGYKIIQKL